MPVITVSAAGGNYNTTAAWFGGALPSPTADTIAADGTSGQLTVTAAVTTMGMNLTGYTQALTLNAALTVSGDVALSSHAGFISGGSGALIVNATSSMTSNGKTWGNPLTFSGANTIKTLVGNWVVTGLFTSLTTTQTVSQSAAGTETLTCNGGIQMTGIMGGSVIVRLNGGTWLGSAVLQNNTNIVGGINIGGAVAYNAGTLTREAGAAGTVNVGSGSVLTIAQGTTLNTSGVTWHSVTIPGGVLLTLNSLLTVSNTLTISGTGPVNFDGPRGFTVATLTITTTGTVTHILTQSSTNIYTVTTALNNTGSTNSLRVTLASSSATAVIFTVNNGATLNCAYLNGTLIDSSGGRIVRTFNGDLNQTTNWVRLTDLVTTGQTF